MSEIYIHVEEPSMEAYLDALLPRLDLQCTARVINHGSKQKLLRDLPLRLAGYARMPVDIRPYVIALVDRDGDDCIALKARLEQAASSCGLHTKSNPSAGRFSVVNRIVVSELDSWHFGDTYALAEIYPGFPANLHARERFRNPDEIAGGVHEALFRELKKAGHFRELYGLPKTVVARSMAECTDPQRNRSRSFRFFLDGLSALAAQIQEAA